MKGIFFLRPLEFRLFIQGEAWQQGDPISGSLTVINHGKEPALIGGAQVSLAMAESKNVEKKHSDAFTVLNSALLSEQMIAPGSEISMNWKFLLDRNCSITDPSSSLFLIYGLGQPFTGLGHLQLRIRPLKIILDLVDLFSLHFHFLVKSQKSRKSFVETKLIPPSSKKFTSMENLLLNCRMNDETLELKYLFNIKKLDATSSVISIKKVQNQIDRTYAPAQYLLPGDRLNHEKLISEIEAVFEELKGPLNP